MYGKELLHAAAHAVCNHSAFGGGLRSLSSPSSSSSAARVSWCSPASALSSMHVLEIMAPTIHRTHCTHMTVAVPKRSLSGLYINVPITAPTLPIPAESPWKVERTWTGNAVTGNTNVATFGPKFSANVSRQKSTKKQCARLMSAAKEWRQMKQPRL